MRFCLPETDVKNTTTGTKMARSLRLQAHVALCVPVALRFEAWESAEIEWTCFIWRGIQNYENDAIKLANFQILQSEFSAIENLESNNKNNKIKAKHVFFQSILLVWRSQETSDAEKLKLSSLFFLWNLCWTFFDQT